MLKCLKRAVVAMCSNLTEAQEVTDYLSRGSVSTDTIEDKSEPDRITARRWAG
jgi:hypothetical protein